MGKIMLEAHKYLYSIHLRATKIYRYFLGDLCVVLDKVRYWEFFAKFPNCEQVKLENQKLGGLSQDIRFLLRSSKI